MRASPSRLLDGNGGLITKKIDVTITGTGYPPVAVDDTNWVQEGTSPTSSTSTSGNVMQTIEHLGRPKTFSDRADTDPRGDPLTVSALSTRGRQRDDIHQAGNSNGTLVINKATGAYIYTVANGQTNVQSLAAGQQVTDTFTYSVTDGQDGTDLGEPDRHSVGSVPTMRRYL